MDPFSMFLMAISAGGSIFKGLSGSMSAGISAKIAETNKELAKIDEQMAYTQGAFQQSRVARAVDATTASIRTGTAAHSLDPNYGSPLLAVMRSNEQGQLDKGLIGAQSELSAAAALARVATATGQEVSAKWDQTSSLISGFLGAGTELLKGGSKWAGLSSSGATGGGSGGFDPVWDPVGTGGG